MGKGAGAAKDPFAVDALWDMMGMKKFSILDDEKPKEAADCSAASKHAPTLPAASCVELQCTPASGGRQVVIALSVRRAQVDVN